MTIFNVVCICLATILLTPIIVGLITVIIIFFICDLPYLIKNRNWNNIEDKQNKIWNEQEEDWFGNKIKKWKL